MATGILLFPFVCLANGGVVMILPFLGWPPMILAFFGIVPIEADSIKKYLDSAEKDKLHDNKKMLRYSFIANLATTLIGFLIAPALTALLVLLGQVPGVISILDRFIKTESDILLPFLICSLIVAFVISVFVERIIMRNFLKNDNKKNVDRAVLEANYKSYAFLVLISLVICLAIS